MKKLYVLFFTVLICSITQAQTKQGDILLGANLGYNNQGYSTNGGTISPNSSNSYNSFNGGLSFGKAVKDNLVLGLNLGYSHYSQAYNPGTATDGNGFNAGIFLRKYKPLGGNFYLFGEVALSGSYTHNSQAEQAGSQLTADITHMYGFSFQFFPGLAYALGPKWQLEAELPSFFSIMYTHSKQSLTYTGQPGQDYNNHNFSIESNFSGANAISAGVRYRIGE